MRKLFVEFETFLLRGNVMELAVAIIIGGALNKIASSLVDDIIAPFISVFLGVVSFSGLQVHVGTSTIQYGLFIQSVLGFVIVAILIFLMIKIMNTFHRKEHDKSLGGAPATEDVRLLREIRDLLKESR